MLVHSSSSLRELGDVPLASEDEDHCEHAGSSPRELVAKPLSCDGQECFLRATSFPGELDDVTLSCNGDERFLHSRSSPRELTDMPLACGGDELFLLPLTALTMEEEELRQELSVQGSGPLFLSPAPEKTFWLSKRTPR